MAGVAGLNSFNKINGCGSEAWSGEPTETAEAPDDCRTFRSREQRAADERRRLTGIRNEHEATSAIGYACSNLMEMRDALPPAADERIDYLTPDHVIEIEARLLLTAKREEARLQRLLAAGE